MSTRAFLTAAIILAVAPQGDAQSLGDLARGSDARRQGTAKVYTNADLPESGGSSAPAQVPAASAPAEASSAASDLKAPAAAAVGDAGETKARAEAGREKRDEPYWRARATQVRSMLQKQRQQVAGLEQRLDALTAQIETTPSPSLVRERDTTQTELVRARKGIESWTGEVTRMEQRARNLKVPEDWIR